MNRVRDALERFIILCDSLQVDLQGQYTTDRFRRFASYANRTRWARVAFLCVASPVPCIALIIVMDSIKLEPPTSKAWEMPRFWTRGTLFTLSLAISNLEQFRHQKPHINLPHRVIVLISALATAIGILQAFAIACYVANPIPFAMLVAAPLWFVILIGSLRFYLRHQIRSQPSLKKDLRQYFVYCSIQLSVPLLYPVYLYAFSSLDSNLQAAFVLVLSLMKLAFKNALSYALGDQDDLKPETIILNVEVFHALFVTYSMQNATSAATVVMLVANDFVHACASLYDVNNLLGQITALVNSIKLRNSLAVTTDMSVMDIALLIVDRDPAGAGDVANMRRMSSSKAAWVALVTRSRQIAPLFSASPTAAHIPKRGPIRSQRNSRVSSNEYTRALPVHGVPPPRPQNERLALLRKTLQLLYLTEFIMLIEFVEIVIPTIYCVYLNAMFRLPNREYYPIIKSMSDEQLHRTAYTVTAYASFEVISLVLMSLMLWSRLRVSVMHQLAFILEEQWAVVQLYFIMWVVYAVHASLEHLGVDYSFKFEWLKHNNNLIGW